MGIASFVIGIIVSCLAFIPFVNYIVVLPAFVGFGIGLTEVILSKKRSRVDRFAVVGSVLNGFSLLSILIWSLVLSVGLSNVLNDFQGEFRGGEGSKENKNFHFKKHFNHKFKRDFNMHQNDFRKEVEEHFKAFDTPFFRKFRSQQTDKKEKFDKRYRDSI